MRILLNTPDVEKSGGVANHFLGLRDKFSVDIYYNYIGGRSSSKFTKGLMGAIKDYFVFGRRISQYNPDVVFLNPSLNRKALIRDGAFLLITKIFFNRKCLVFIHGWDDKTANRISGIMAKLFQLVFNNADAFCVLSKKFKKQLENWDIKSIIYIETTKVDDDLIKDFDRKNITRNRHNLLFFARLEANKGIYEILEAYTVVKKKFPDLSLTIAGNGSEFKNVKTYIENRWMSDVVMLGYVRGDQKISALKEGSIYLLPTSHGEGLPTSILEAMAFGLPVITCPVGGIPEVIEDGVNGFLMDKPDVEELVIHIEKLLSDSDLSRSMAEKNYDVAREKFLASIVARRLEDICKSLV